MRTMLRAKIHRARITSVNVDYEGSIAIDRNLMDAADILPYEMVSVLDINNGQRFQTYVIEGEPGSGVISINGAAARLVCKGDTVIILAYSTVDRDEACSMQPSLVYVDSANNIVSRKGKIELFRETKQLLTTLAA